MDPEQGDPIAGGKATQPSGEVVELEEQEGLGTETVQELARRVVAESRSDDRFVRVAEVATRASSGPTPVVPEDEQQALTVIADLHREEPVPTGAAPPPDS